MPPDVPGRDACLTPPGQHALARLAAVAVVASGYALKFILITRAGYQQGFALERAGGLIRPGWKLADRPA